MASQTWVAAVLLSAVAGVWAQVVPYDSPTTRLCSVTQEQLRVLPSAGFGRGPLQPYQSTQFAPASAPQPAVSDLSDCLYVSFDPEFESLLGDNRTIYQVGPSRQELWAVETPAWLPGERCCVLPAFCELGLPPFESSSVGD